MLAAAALGAGGTWAATRLEWGGTGEAALGIGAAWLIQVVAFWTLHRALATGRRVIPIWISGMVARAGAIAVLWVAARAGGLSSRELLISYVIAILVYLILEAAWLAIGGTGGVRGTSGHAAE